MEIKFNLTNTEHKELISYCNLNDLLVSEIVKKSFTTGFNIERYGLLGTDQVTERVVEKIVEKRVEIPVEVIKEVVKIEYVEVEKPVEVIKEIVKVEYVEVEKPVEVIKEVEKIFQDNSKIDELTQLFSTKTEEMENIFQKEKEQLLKKIDELGEGKIVEVPVEVIKEVILEKEPDDTKIKALEQTLQKLKFDNIDKDKKIKELEDKIIKIQLEQPNKATYLRGSNLNDKLF